MKIQRKTTNSRWRAPWKAALLALGIYAAQSTGQHALSQPYLGYGNGTLSHTVGPGLTEYTDNVRTPVIGTNSPLLEITVANLAGFMPGQRVLVIQMESCMSGCPVGNYYISTINSINFATNTITFNSAGVALPMPPFCTGGGMDRVQAIVIPEWFGLDVFGTYTCNAWDGFTGGVVCFYVKNVLTVHPGGIISSDGKGYFNNLVPGFGGPGGAGGGPVGVGGNPSSPANGSDGFPGGMGGTGTGEPGLSGVSKCPQYKGGDGGWGGGPIPGFPGTPGTNATCIYPLGDLMMGNGGWRSGMGGIGGGGGGEGGGGGGSLTNGMPGMPGGPGGMGGNGAGPEGPGAGAMFIKAKFAFLNAIPSLSARGGNGLAGQPGGPGGFGGDGGNGSNDDANVGAGGGGGFGWRGNGAGGGGGSDAGSGAQIWIVTSTPSPVLPNPVFDEVGGLGGPGGPGGYPFPFRASYGLMGNSSPTWNYCPVTYYYEECNCEEAYKALARTTSATLVGTQMVFTDGAGLVCTYDNGTLSCQTPVVLTSPATPVSGDVYTQTTYTCDVDPLTECYQLFQQIMANAGSYNPGPPPTFGNPGPIVYSMGLLSDGTLNCYDKACDNTCRGDCPEKGPDGPPGSNGTDGSHKHTREDEGGDNPPVDALLGTGDAVNGEIAGLTVNPNPATEKITVSFGTPLGGNAKVRITNAQGVTLTTETVNCKKGINQLDMNIASFKPGAYFVTVETKQSTASKPFIKQ